MFVSINELFLQIAIISVFQLRCALFFPPHRYCQMPMPMGYNPYMYGQYNLPYAPSPVYQTPGQPPYPAPQQPGYPYPQQPYYQQ